MEQGNLQQIIKKGIFKGKKERTRGILLFSDLIKPTGSEMIRSRRIHAIEEALSSSNLDKIDKWDEQTPRKIVDHLLELGYREELEIWISDPDRIQLDPERVEKVETVVREVCDKIN